MAGEEAFGRQAQPVNCTILLEYSYRVLAARGLVAARVRRNANGHI